MARTVKIKPYKSDVINVKAFQNIQIRFRGDVYILAVWLAMADKAKSTATMTVHTTLSGLAGHYASLNRSDSSTNTLYLNDIMAIFKSHGITGNPSLELNATEELLPPLAMK